SVPVRIAGIVEAEAASAFPQGALLNEAAEGQVQAIEPISFIFLGDETNHLRISLRRYLPNLEQFGFTAITTPSNNASLAVTWSPNGAQVFFATNSEGAPTSTLAQVLAALHE